MGRFRGGFRTLSDLLIGMFRSIMSRVRKNTGRARCRMDRVGNVLYRLRGLRDRRWSLVRVFGDGIYGRWSFVSLFNDLILWCLDFVSVFGDGIRWLWGVIDRPEGFVGWFGTRPDGFIRVLVVSQLWLRGLNEVDVRRADLRRVVVVLHFQVALTVHVVEGAPDGTGGVEGLHPRGWSAQEVEGVLHQLGPASASQQRPQAYRHLIETRRVIS